MRDVKYDYELLIHARGTSGLSQQAVSDKMECSQPHYSALELGIKPVNAPRLMAMSKATGCSFWFSPTGGAVLKKDETKKLYNKLKKKAKINAVVVSIRLKDLVALAKSESCSFWIWKDGITMFSPRDTRFFRERLKK